MIPSTLLHGPLPLHGTAGLAANVLLYAAILLAALALVLLSDGDRPLVPDKLVWGLAILAIPLIGPATYLVRWRRDRAG